MLSCACQNNNQGALARTRRIPISPARPSVMAHRPPVRPVMGPHGSYRRFSGLGQIAITGNPAIDSLLENPFTLALGAVGLFAAWYFLVPSFSTSGGSLHVKRRRAPTVSLPTAALLGVGGAAAGYLLSNYGGQGQGL